MCYYFQNPTVAFRFFESITLSVTTEMSPEQSVTPHCFLLSYSDKQEKHLYI